MGESALGLLLLREFERAFDQIETARGEEDLSIVAKWCEVG